jgi:hypothetical protein
MSYTRFKFAETANTPAAFAALAAVQPENALSAANAASAAGLQGKFENSEPAPSAANAASAAAPQAKSEKFERCPVPAAIPQFELQVAFETLVLASCPGVPDDRARRDARAIFRAMIGNDARLVPPQPNPWRCVVCGESGSANSPLVPVLTPTEGEHRWLHLGCHDAYQRQVEAAVDDLLRDAGILP